MCIVLQNITQVSAIPHAVTNKPEPLADNILISSVIGNAIQSLLVLRGGGVCVCVCGGGGGGGQSKLPMGNFPVQWSSRSVQTKTNLCQNSPTATVTPTVPPPVPATNYNTSPRMITSNSSDCRFPSGGYMTISALGEEHQSLVRGLLIGSASRSRCSGRGATYTNTVGV